MSQTNPVKLYKPAKARAFRAVTPRIADSGYAAPTFYSYYGYGQDSGTATASPTNNSI